MSEDTDSPPEREMKDFQFRQMKKARVFEPTEDLPKERSSLLTISNKFGLTFVGLDRTFKVYSTLDILAANKVDGNSNEIVDGIAALAEVTVEVVLHHLALSCDELTLSVCGMSEETGLSLTFYDVRTFMNQARPHKLPFASLQPAVSSGTIVQDLKWNPAQSSTLAACMSDGSMIILEITDSVKVQAGLPASSGITCICWSPKGKQVAAGKMNATVSQYTPALEEKKVIQCPPFYPSASDEPVKVLDVLWLKTYVFAVVYAAADGSLETPPDLVLISLPKKDEKLETKYLNFSDTVYGNCTERQHHYFLSYIEDWELVFAASAASIEVSIIARQDDKIWELWMLEDASRAELPVTETNDDTLPLGLAIDYTSQQEIHITDEKTLPPAPTMLILSTEGLLCPFALLNLNPGVKQLVSPPTLLSLEGERVPKADPVAVKPPKTAASILSVPAAFPNLSLSTAAASTPPAPAASSSAPPFNIVSTAPVSSSGFTFSVPATGSTTSSAFSLGGSTPFGSGSSGFSFATKPLSDNPLASSAFSFSTPSIKPVPAPAPAPAPPPQNPVTASPPTVKLNLNERFSAVETQASASQPFSFGSSLPKTVVSNTNSLTTPSLSATKTPAVLTPVRPVQTSTPATVIQKPAPAAQGRVQTPQATVSMKALEKQLQQKKDSDPIMAGILEEIAHFQKELDDLKARSARADFKIGTNEEMKELRKESEDLHIFTLEIKETTESLHGDIGTLKTTLLEGFAGAEEAKARSELSRDRNYRQLLYKKPLDPRSEEQLKEIRRLYQYVMFAVEDVNDVLDVEWEKHLEKKKKQKHMVVPGREGLFTTLANNLHIINQQKNRLDQLVKELTSLQLYKTTTPTLNHTTAAATTGNLESELQSLRDALLKTRLDTTPPKSKSKSPVKISPGKQSQLRNFLSKGQMPPVRSTAPANLSRSAFLSPKYYEDLDDVSSTSSLSQSLDPHQSHLDLEDEELPPQPLPMPVIPIPALSTPRHPTVVRTPSIQPGFGAIQSTPLTKNQSVQGVGFGLSPIVNPIPTNKINLSGAESTALATKTVKHGAPPTERAIPVTVSPQQAAATAALRRQMANQKTVVSASLTESTLKTVPQVVNVQELKDKVPSVSVSSIISSSAPDPAAQIFAAVSSNPTKRNPTMGIQKMPTESTTNPQANFVFGQPSKTDVAVASANSVEQSNSKGFSFTAGSSFSFASVTQGVGMPQVKDSIKFSFGNGKMLFGQTGEEPFSLTPKSSSPALGTMSPTLPSNTSGEAAKPTSTTTAPKTVGGETLGNFSGLRVGQGEEAKDSTKPAGASFTFGESGFGMGKGTAQFSFGASLQKSAEDSTGADLSKGSVQGSSLFKPPEMNTKPTFSVPQPGSTASVLPTSFSSLLAATSDPLEEPKAPTLPSEPALPPEKEPVSKPTIESTIPTVVLQSAGDAANTETTTATTETTESTTMAAPTPALSLNTTGPTSDLPSSITTPTEAIAPATASTASTIEATGDNINTAPVPTSAAATPATPISQLPPPAFPVPNSEKPGSIFTQPAPATTDSNSLGVSPVISTAAPAASTVTPTVVNSTTTVASSVFGQTSAPPASSAPSTPASTGFGSAGFGTSTGASFGKSVFGQVSSFGQPAIGTSTGFSFGQSAFGASSSNVTTGGGSLFGASTASNVSSFSFGTSSANTASSTGAGLFGQSTAPAFGQSSAFGQGSVFGSNTTTSSSTGFSFGQSSGKSFGCSSAAPVFGQQPSSGSVFGQQQPSSGGSLFGSSSANVAGTSVGVGFFSGLGGKPTEEAANKNPFGTTAATGGFGQSAQTGTSSLFGNSGAKTFSFGQTPFGEQKSSGTFSTGGGSVASQGFGSFSTPTKSGGFGTAPVFGSPPSFGGSPAFGGAASFGSNASFNSTMGSSAGKVFGEGTAAASMGGFGFASAPSAPPSFGALANQNTPSFGTLAQQGPGFGSQPSSFSGFGQQPQAGGFSGNTFGSANQPSSQTFATWRS
ncbi:nuclear pore complex protein Nup214 isoform X1 [Mastacembelus armatus]|uniref:nuclear pore complex protein Nup214 isoform X1 n=1 Tax=Mastacembelus armatus TaxID=205130 RepID=UPI000E453D22|nr:nuclear pore complex protein Nup214 isoform X1 [Mastacembelus armatus]